MSTISRLPIQPINNWWGADSPMGPPSDSFLTRVYGSSPAWSSTAFPGPYRPIACTTQQDVFDPVLGYLGRGVLNSPNTPIPRSFAVKMPGPRPF